MSEYSLYSHTTMVALPHSFCQARKKNTSYPLLKLEGIKTGINRGGEKKSKIILKRQDHISTTNSAFDSCLWAEKQQLPSPGLLSICKIFTATTSPQLQIVDRALPLMQTGQLAIDLLYNIRPHQ